VGDEKELEVGEFDDPVLEEVFNEIFPEDIPEEGYSWDRIRKGLSLFSELTEEWEGIPVPLTDVKMVLNSSHPLKKRFDDFYKEMQAIERPFEPEEATFVCKNEDVAFVRNRWWSVKKNAWIQIFEKPDTFVDGQVVKGRIFHKKIYVSPDRSMERLDLWLRTIAAVTAWDLEAEYKARESLKDMLSEHAYRCYELTGSFLEYSERSKLYYLFRRGRPTVVLSPRNKYGHEEMICLAVLCMHPIGYYQETWGGCMVPTDDVIAHLTFMRGDEAGFWKQSVQHKPSDPEAGL
jgi:hypothetical protein